MARCSYALMGSGVLCWVTAPVFWLPLLSVSLRTLAFSNSTCCVRFSLKAMIVSLAFLSSNSKTATRSTPALSPSSDIGAKSKESRVVWLIDLTESEMYTSSFIDSNFFIKGNIKKYKPTITKHSGDICLSWFFKISWIWEKLLQTCYFMTCLTLIQAQQSQFWFAQV